MSTITLREDIIPALATLDSGPSWSPARVYIGMDTVYAYADTMTGPAEVFTARFEEVEGSITTGWVLYLANGDVLRVQRISHCLCGSRLRSIRPWSSIRHAPNRVK